MRVYISGPIAGHDDYRETFAEAEKQLAAAGYDVTNPVRATEHLNDLTYEQLMQIDIVLLDFCDAIYMLPGWQQSKAMICDKTEMSGKKIRKTLDRLQRKGFLGIHYRTEFFGMSQYYYPIIKADAYLRYFMERLQELTGKKIILVESG